jgi:hypothetical protein
VVYGECVEEANCKDGDCEDANIEEDHHRRAALLAKRRREVPPTPLALLHRQMVHGRMEWRHGKRVSHRVREDGTKTADDVDAGPSGATSNDNDDSEAIT